MHKMSIHFYIITQIINICIKVRIAGYQITAVVGTLLACIQLKQDIGHIGVTNMKDFTPLGSLICLFMSISLLYSEQYTVKNVSGFPVPSRAVIYQTLPSRE